MKDHQSHIIKKQQYEIELNAASKSYEYQSKISKLQEQSIQFVLQKVMDAQHSPNHLDQYDEIVLDLGSVSVSNFERELIYKIEEAFVHFFKNNTYSNGTLIKGKRTTIYKTQLDQFVFFLKNGHLQWDTPSSSTPKILLSEAFKNNREGLITALKKEGKKEYIRKRLISQLQDSVLEQIVIAIEDKTGEYINQSRKEIIKHQENQNLVETNKHYFRNALWEIILAYIFIEVTSISNQKSFLKYLIRKIASKYNLTYKKLLKKISLGIKSSKNKTNRLANFGQIVILLQEEIDVQETTPRIHNERISNFKNTLKYYLQYNSLPINSTVKSIAVFSEQVKEFIKKEPVVFHNILLSFMSKNTSNISLFTSRFSTQINNTIITNSKDVTLVSITHFFKALKNTATQINVTSSTLNKIEKQLGEISLNAYYQVHKNSTNVIKEFLLQVIKIVTLDEGFLLLLKIFKTTSNQSNIPVSFIDGILKTVNFQTEIIPKKSNTAFIEFSVKLHAHYKQKRTVSLTQFQSNLIKENYKESSLKLITVLLDVFSKNKSAATKIYIDWIRNRLFELDDKGENIPLILTQITKIIQTLNIERKVIDAIIETKNTYQQQKKAHKTVSETNTKKTAKLYTYYKDKTSTSLTEFQTILIESNLKDASLHFLQLLLTTFSKNKIYTQKAVTEWIEKQVFELSKKGENSSLLLAQVIKVIPILNVDKKIVEAISKIQKTNQYQKNKKVSSSNNERYKNRSEEDYNELIKNINKTLFSRSEQNIYNAIKELLALFSKKHNVSETHTIKTLIKEYSDKNIPESILTILNNITTNTNNVIKDDHQYHLDSVAYFFSNSKLPWWINDKSSVSFQKSMQVVLNQQPELFVKWFKKAKEQKTIVDLMSADLYEIFIKQINATVTKTIVTTKLLFENLLQKDIAGIQNRTAIHKKELQYLFLEFILFNKQIDILKIADFIIDKLSQKTALSKENLHVFLLGRIKIDTATFKNLKKLENYLEEKIIEPKSLFKNEIQKIEDRKPWEEAILSNNSKEIITAIQLLYKENSEVLFFHLKKATFRSNLISKLRVKNQKEVLILFFSPENQSKLTIVFEIFKNLQKQITANNYQIIWSYFVDRLLLKIGVSNTTNWRIDEWSLLILDSLSYVKHSQKTDLLISKITIPNNTTSEKIIVQMRSLQNDRTVITKQEKVEIVPEVIEKETIEGTVFIENAGMVILGPYIPMLFQRMGFIENKAFKDEVSKQKAMYVLQYAATGKTEVEEHTLFLNKIICNVDMYMPLGPTIDLTSEEKELIDSLLKALIAHWKALGNTSVEGFKASFLSRAGSIIEEEKRFVLVVEEKSYDMLLDHIPWSVGQIKLSWMEKLIDITWRTNK